MSTASVLPVSVSSTARIRISRDDITLRSGLVLLITLLVIAVVFPLYSLLSKSFEAMDGAFVGLQNFREYFETPALSHRNVHCILLNRPLVKISAN